MTTYRRFVLDKASAVAAIYDTTTRDLSLQNEPLSAPLSYVSRLHFHSGLDYPKVISTITGTVTLPVMGINTLRTHEYVISAHGRAGTPYVEGKVHIGGVWIPLAGSTVVAQLAAPSAAFVRFLALGANGTNIVIEEYSLSSSGAGFASVGIDYEIYLLDTLL